MIRLTYISTAQPDIDPGAPAAILLASRRNNQRGGLTGMLLFDGRRFLQAIEGPEIAIESAFKRIMVDPRHRACVVLDRKPIVRRAFGEWDMAWRRLEHQGSDARTLAEAVDAMVSQVDDPSLSALFSGFVRVREPVLR